MSKRVANFSEVIRSEMPDENKVRHIQVRMMEVLEDLDDRFRDAIQDYNLDEPEDVLFTGYNPAQLYDIVVPIQTLFTRADAITSLFKTMLRWLPEQYDFTNMPDEILENQDAILEACTEMRDKYVNDYSYKMIRALRREIVHYDPKTKTPKTTKKSAGSFLNGLLLRYFGVKVMKVDRKEDPALQMLISMLDDLGAITGHKKAADELIQAVKHIDD